MNTETPHFVELGSSTDDRGSLYYLNEFPDKEWKRFYVVENHASDYIRAWHGHKFEEKLVVVLQGAAIFATVKIDNFQKPNQNLMPEKLTLSREARKALYIPAGFANGFKTLTSDTKLLFFSSKTLEESINDDFRFSWDYWNIWNVDYR